MRPSAAPSLAKICLGVKVYESHLVQVELEKQRDLLLSKLSDKTQRALRAYVIDEFPQTVTVTKQHCNDGDSVVLKNALEETDQSVARFATKLAAVRTDAISLKITSNPPQAVFSFSPEYDDEDRQEVSTNTTIKNVWRGKYKYTLKKEGYRSIEGVARLIDGDAIVATCDLAPDTAVSPPGTAIAHSAPPNPCNFQ